MTEDKQPEEGKKLLSAVDDPSSLNILSSPARSQANSEKNANAINAHQLIYLENPSTSEKTKEQDDSLLENRRSKMRRERSHSRRMLQYSVSKEPPSRSPSQRTLVPVTSITEYLKLLKSLISSINFD